MLVVRLTPMYPGDHESFVVVTDTLEHMKARFAAYVYRYGVAQRPSIFDLLTNTTVYLTSGVVSAKIYNYPKFDGEKTIPATTHPTREYVEWLEEQLGINS